MIPVGPNIRKQRSAFVGLRGCQNLCKLSIQLWKYYKFSRGKSCYTEGVQFYTEPDIIG